MQSHLFANFHLKCIVNRVQSPRSKAERNVKPSSELHGKGHYPGEHRELHSVKSMSRNGPVSRSADSQEYSGTYLRTVSQEEQALPDLVLGE